MPIIVPSTAGGVTFADLQSELSARGFSYLDTPEYQARRDRFINRGYQQLCEEEDWPFLNAQATGAAPLAIDDLRSVTSVVNAAGVQLEERSLSWVLDENPALDQAGSGVYFWQDSTTVNVWPSDPQPVTVRYTLTPPVLAATGDQPVVPDRYRLLIVDYAVIQALRDRSNFQEAQALYDVIQQQELPRMREALMDYPMYQRLT
jgi:hypothetical protein